jgi:hypothetical protein
VGVREMTEPINKVPAEARWQIATKGLTGAVTAYCNALKNAVGEAKYNEFSNAVWYQGGQALKDIVDAFGLPVESARQIEEALELSARASMGPEFEFEVVEATQDRCMARLSKCPWHERWKEQGMGWDFCRFGHQGWGQGAVEGINPDFAHSLTKSMPGGDPYCEFVIERKK